MRGEVEEDAAGEGRAPVVFDDQVLFHAELADHAVAHPLFGDVGQPVSQPPVRLPGGDVVLVEPQPAARGAAQTGDEFGQLALPVAGDPGDPQDLPRPHFQADPSDGRQAAVALSPDVVQAQPHLPLLDRRSIDAQQHLAPDHQARQFPAVRFGRARRLDDPPVAQHRDAVADRQHFVQLVADEDQQHGPRPPCAAA